MSGAKLARIDDVRSHVFYEDSLQLAALGSTEPVGIETFGHDEPACKLIRRNRPCVWNKVGNVQRRAILDAATST
ncbi:hypothetical protein AF336_33325 [Bradyrhizobium diazoefficiens]|jgi:hypothetical protein|uniref:Uncharacterized protein n=1 Tax=Bradyrhizobium diazoefficiens SEMIA 5080 TaxID=754504 RepID=A0A837C3G1_9BRAD|nr:hypothetical protein BJA5080_05693 [Bradyrhizobium diazoefficiens SEMIA 5080]KOY06005.1 hypothetical protein AF336_33325 [Bradyrhizobium diazoefficiens]